MLVKRAFSFVTNDFEYSEIGTKSGNKAVIKGYISTEEVDRANEVVTREAMDDMVTQIKNGNVKLDVEHGTFTGENDIPVGKITNAGMDEKGLWIEAQLNSSHDKFKSIWESIKGGFLDAFSIAYKVKDWATDVVDNQTVKLLKSLELLNVAITGNPMNRGAKMTESFYKSMTYLKNEEDKKMSEDVKVEPKVEEPKVEDVKVEEKVEEPKVEDKVEEPKVEEKVEEKPEPEPKEEVKVEEKEEVINPLSTIKNLESLNKELETKLKSLESQFKEFKEEISKPQMKAIGATDIAEVKSIANNEVKSPLDSIK